MGNDVILALVVITALAFDLTNGFHDTGNAMATSIATRALPPRVAVALSGLLNLIGAFLSPVIAALVAAVGTWSLYRISRNLTRGARNHGFRIGQIGSACMVSLAHGTNDAQKTMGVITLALIANGTLAAKSNAPFWVILACALAISIGTYLGGWRVIRTLGKGLVEIESPQGMAAESSSAAIILLSASFGYSLSTTHVATGSIIGTGLGKKGADVRWSVAGRMATAWVFTLPSAAIVGAGAYGLAHGIGGSTGVIIDLILLVLISGAIYWRSRSTKVDHNNVNDEWSGGVDHVYGGNVLGAVIAAICLLIILAALGWGIYEVYQIGHPPVKH